jgi:ribosomal protein S18 acetylase RimI-like enzyme
MDYFQNVGELGLASRLKRLSDAFMSEVKSCYEAEGVEFEPRWFPLYSLLLQQREATVTYAAQQLNLTHPHISLLAKELARAGLIAFRKDAKDARSRILVLTARGQALAKEVAGLWESIRTAVRNVLDETDPRLLEHLEKVEDSLRARPFSGRVREAARHRAARKCRIVGYDPKLKGHFEKLNREWIETHFSIEPHDTRAFADPEKEIIRRGGDVIFAELDGKIVGTCSLIIDDQGKHELAKLAVTDRAKGKGLGELLSREIIRRARRKGARSVILTTNSRLTPAIRLYEKLGFKETIRGPHPKFKRVDLVMEKRL